MKLGRLLEGIPVYDLEGDKGLEITGIAYDSRKIRAGDLFVAIKGHSQNGGDYIEEAIQRGAVALVAEEIRGSYGTVSVIRVPDSRDSLSKLASRFYDSPCEGLEIIGITGTNGKTTTSYILESILTVAGAKPGVIGTINYRYMGKTRPAPVTTPESLDLMCLIREMADSGVTHVVMEVSSHALDQKRTGDCLFKTAVFTNFSRDHLDYHETMEEYFKAKSLLFSGLPGYEGGGKSTAVINLDDPRGRDLASLVNGDLLTYGLSRECDLRADIISNDKKGLRARIMAKEGETEIRSAMIGRVNIYNILAATGAALSMGLSLRDVAEGIERLKKVPGRLELVENMRGLTVVVDYAHTPDALLKAQETLRPLTEGRLITLFGCGGDRDKGKRFEMGLSAGENSDIVFITSDNPRSEDPGSIVEQIEEGVKKTGLLKREWPPDSGSQERAYFIEVDRRKAIYKAISIAEEKDVILIAGKGHEDYQITGSERKFFDDRKEVIAAAS